jgi:glycosyltransferase involved in cell wall biosynthesis
MTTWRERLNGLRWRGRAMRRLWSPGAQPEMPFLPPIKIPDTTGGKLDHPGAGVVLDEGTIGFGGWVAFEVAPTARVDGWLDETYLGRARTGIERPDVAAAKDLPFAALSGFEFSADVRELPAARRVGTGSVRVIATSVEGERFEFEPIPVELRPIPLPTSPELSAPAKLTPTVPRAEAGPRTLVVTHQLTLGGAQLYLLDLIRGLMRERAIDPVVVSAVDGPLRKTLEEMGIPVHVTSVAPFEKLVPHLGRVEELVAWAAPHEFEVAFINTATSPAFFGAEAATSLGIPAVWAIHESFPPALLWADLKPEVRERAEATVGSAAAAIFEADATKRIFERLIDPARCLTVPYGVDFGPIERARAELDQRAARREEGIPDDAELVVCIGTVEPRKAQISLAQAFELIARDHPRAHLAFVGGRKEDSYSEDLEEFIEESSFGERMKLIPITPDVERWYGIADLLVCASDVESLPRTVLEAMAWETPVLATDVFGLPELIDDGETGWLCESRDTRALADGLDSFLRTDPEERSAVAARARALVEERHSLPTYAKRVQRIINEAIEGSPSVNRKEDSTS